VFVLFVCLLFVDCLICLLHCLFVSYFFVFFSDVYFGEYKGHCPPIAVAVKKLRIDVVKYSFSCFVMFGFSFFYIQD
jgi:hypothetical protein